MTVETLEWLVGILALTVLVLLRWALGLERRVSRLEGRNDAEHEQLEHEEEELER